MKGKLIIFSAPSGSGKTTIVKHLLSLDIGLAFSISATSREPRSNETDGKDYYFLSPEDFKLKISEGHFLEWEEVYENQYYGTLRSEIERLRNEGIHVLFDIDVVGGVNLKKEFGEDSLAIFVQSPSLEELEKRLLGRGSDSDLQLKRRIDKAEEEMSYSNLFDYILINDHLATAFAEAEKIVHEFIKN
jgi:guanylate kinase